MVLRDHSVVIIDYGMGNIQSIIRHLDHAGVHSIVSSNPNIIIAAEKLILPGVGHFGQAMKNIRTLGILDSLNEAVINKKTPIMGICLGMQLMAKYSEEGDQAGLGWFDGNVVRFKIQDKLRFKVPHMGWNYAHSAKTHNILQNIPSEAEFYFVHSFHFSTDVSEDVLMNTHYAYQFPSAIQKENIFGFQFHPEKSHDVGKKLLRNFIGL